MNGALFEKLCRHQGTRCNAIMTMIEEGYKSDYIAKKYGTTKDTIEVYRKALYGELSDFRTYEAPCFTAKTLPEKKKDLIIRDYTSGMSLRAIARQYGISSSCVFTVIKQARMDGKVTKNKFTIEKGRNEKIRKYDAAYEGEIEKMLESGKKKWEIIKELGIDERTYIRIRKRRLREGAK